MSEIASKHNFDLGNEFEIAICEFLRAVLPERYGVCQGFIITADGLTAGDDIIVYESTRFPLLRLMEEDFSRKQQVPVESVYAYIEAKHSLVLEGDGPQSLSKALKQVTDAKALPREPITVKNAFHPSINFSNLRSRRPNWPKYLNPLYGAIFARQIRTKKGSTPLRTTAKIAENFLAQSKDSGGGSADLIVAGDNVVLLPMVGENGSQTFYSPYYVEGKSSLLVHSAPGLAFAIGVCSLLYALDSTILGAMPWPRIIADATGFSLS